MTRRIPVSALALGLVLAGCGSSYSKPSASASSSKPKPASGSSSSSQGSGYGGYGGASSTASTTSAASSAAPAASASSGHTVRTSADPSGKLAFTVRTLKAKAGRVTIVMSDPASSGLPHGIAVEGHGVDKDGKTVTPGSASRLTVKLKPGRYEFYCPVPGHKAAGMKGVLIVR